MSLLGSLADYCTRDLYSASGKTVSYSKILSSESVVMAKRFMSEVEDLPSSKKESSTCRQLPGSSSLNRAGKV